MMGPKITDRYIRYVKDIPEPPRGLSILDFSRVRPGPNIPLIREVGQIEEKQSYSKDSGELLCRGAAVGLDEDGLCRHIWPHFAPQLFCGFALWNSESALGKNDLILVMTRGAVFLTIPGVCTQG